MSSNAVSRYRPLLTGCTIVSISLVVTRLGIPIRLVMFNILFRCADSIFTERILGVPAENYKAYVEADATQKGRQIPSYSYFLIHGLADVTAPYQHGIQLARSLSESGTIFRYLVSVTA